MSFGITLPRLYSSVDVHVITAAAEAPAEATGDNLLLNFSIPAKTIYKNQNVASVIIPVRGGVRLT